MSDRLADTSPDPGVVMGPRLVVHWIWRLLVVEREQWVSPTSPGEILARSAIAVRPRDDSRVTTEDPSLDEPCRPTLVMSCRARTRHTYNGTRRDGRMV